MRDLWGRISGAVQHMVERLRVDRFTPSEAELRRERVPPPAEPVARPRSPRAKPNADPRRLPQPIWQKLSRQKTRSEGDRL